MPDPNENFPPDQLIGPGCGPLDRPSMMEQQLNQWIEKMCEAKAKQDFKYNEPDLLLEALEYIAGTYGEHYTPSDEQAATILDLWETQDIIIPALISNVQKYAFRYGRKAGHNRKDLLKIIHYTVFLMYFAEKLGLEDA